MIVFSMWEGGMIWTHDFHKRNLFEHSLLVSKVIIEILHILQEQQMSHNYRKVLLFCITQAKINVAKINAFIVMIFFHTALATTPSDFLPRNIPKLPFFADFRCMMIVLLQETFLAVILLLIYSFLQSFPFFSTRACHSRLNMKQISAKIIFVYAGFSVKGQTMNWKFFYQLF